MEKKKTERPFTWLVRTHYTLRNIKEALIENTSLVPKQKYLLKEVIDSLRENVFFNRKKDLSKEQLMEISRCMQNAWINEAFLRKSRKIPLENVFFFLDYVCFYYSMYSSLSAVVRALEPSLRKQGHEIKIFCYNEILIRNKEIRKVVKKPFSLVIKQSNIYNLNSSQKVKADKTFLRTLRRAIEKGKVSEYLKEGERTLRVLRTLLKFYDTEYSEKAKKAVSIINYLMRCRHFFHYRSSSIFDEKYVINRYLKPLKEDMQFVICCFNACNELFLKHYAKVDLESIFENFKKKVEKNVELQPLFEHGIVPVKPKKETTFPVEFNFIEKRLSLL